MKTAEAIGKYATSERELPRLRSTQVRVHASSARRIGHHGAQPGSRKEGREPCKSVRAATLSRHEGRAG